MYQNSNMILFILYLIIPIAMFHQTTSSPWATYCDNTTMFVNNSAYQTNLNTLFSALSSNATNNPTGYHQAIVNNPPNETIYGHYMCRGDVNISTCHDCVAFATTTDIPSRCPNRKDAIVSYTDCLVRYSNQSFFGNLDAHNIRRYWKNRPIIGNSTKFMEVVDDLIGNVIATKAAEGGSFKKFATEFANYSILEPIYAYGQCTPDLSPTDCCSCINISTRLFRPSPGGRVFGPSCIIQYQNYQFFNLSFLPQPPQPSSSPSPTRHISPVTKPKEKKKFTAKLITSTIAALVVFSAALFFLCICLLKRKSRKPVETNPTDILELNVESLQYDLAKLVTATNNFRNENKLGEGGFGGVYKGTLQDGRVIAVKRLSIGSSQGMQEFKTEVLLVAKLQHRNLVRLLGFCYTVKEKLLVYEYMANKSLEKFIFDNENRQQLSWQKRYNIIRGIARGLSYLHHDCQLIIIHRDLKASNILLDEKMNPKISDFGTSRIFGVDQSHTNYTNRVIGTRGYMAPEYALQGQFSIKSDVYSFGVLVLEIISGRRNFTRNNLSGHDIGEVVNHAWRQWQAHTPLECVDPLIRESCSNDGEVMRCIQLGLLCVQESAEDRPTMANVVLTLESYSVTLPVPEQPDLFTRTRVVSTPLSVNDVSITEPEAR